MSGRPGPRLAVLDPLSLVGKELNRSLEDSALALEGVQLFGTEEGTVSEFGGEAGVLRLLREDSLEPCDVLVACGAGETLHRSLPWLGSTETTVLDLTGTLELSAEVRLLGSGGGHLGGRWLRGRHPASRSLGTVLGPLARSFTVLAAEGMVFEPVAAFGLPGIDELYQQTRELLAFRSVPTAVLGQRLAFNLTPEPLARTRAVEARIRDEVLRSLGLGSESIRVALLRAPIFLGMAIHLAVELEEEAALLDEVLAEADGIDLVEQTPAPAELKEEGTAAVQVHRLPGSPGWARLWLVSDYLRASVADAVGWLEAYRSG